MTYKIGLALVVTAAVSFMPMTASAHDNGYNHRHQTNQNDQLAGGVIGAIAGGVIGSQLAGNGARTEGSVLGAVIGGVAGASIVGRNNQSRTYGHTTYSQPHYNHGGYYNYQQPRYSHTYSYGHPSYSSHYYHRPPTYSYTSRSHYGSGYHNRPSYYGGAYYNSRPNVTISIGTGHGYSGYRGRGYRSYNSNRRRHHHRRRHGH